LRRLDPRLVELFHEQSPRLETPGLLEAEPTLGNAQLGKPREHRGPALVVIGDEVDVLLRFVRISCSSTLSSKNTTDLPSSLRRTNDFPRTFNAGVRNQMSSTTSGSSRPIFETCSHFIDDPSTL
jgi:hypothetical protein